MISSLNVLICLSVNYFDWINIQWDNIIENTSYTLLMLFSTMLLRREYTRMGRTSYILIGFWAFMILSPLTVLIFAIISGNHSNEPRYVLKLVSLILNTLLVVFVGLKRIDLENVYSRSTSIYQQLLKTYFIERVKDYRKLKNTHKFLASCYSRFT